jgi:hypothetical protein
MAVIMLAVVTIADGLVVRLQRDRGPDGPRPDVVHQVFRLAGGLVVDIRGYPQREVALAVADTPLPGRG